MKISPVSSAANSPTGTPDPQVSRVRAVRMTTNVTPGREAAPAEVPLAIPDTNEPANGVVEATEPLSPQLAAIAKQKRALQQERQAFEREKAEAAAAAPAEGHIAVAQLKSDPLRTMLEAGVTYDQLTEAILTDQSNGGSELRALKAEIAALKEGVDKKLSDKDAQAEQAVLAEMQKDAERLSKEGDDFELVRETGSISQVMDLIKRTYKETGEVLDVREALQLVEDELITESLKLAAMKKVQGKLQPEPVPAPQPQQRPRTLTNGLTAAVPMSRKERALLAFRGQLPK